MLKILTEKFDFANRMSYDGFRARYDSKKDGRMEVKKQLFIR